MKPKNFFLILFLTLVFCTKREKEKSFFEQFPDFLNPIIAESNACSAATDAYPSNAYPCYLKSEDPIFYRYDTNVFIDPSTTSVPQGIPIGCRCRLNANTNPYEFNLFASSEDYPANGISPTPFHLKVTIDGLNWYIDSLVSGNIIVCLDRKGVCDGKKVYQKLLIE
ncbi:hypothetical protein P3G55_20360 [Leptospira sp. 96542]|nr:hypothetical protein [Leptospira sp. 96542]